MAISIQHDVVIDGRTYRLSEAGVERVKEDLVAAARSGGAFVTLSEGAALSLEVLITDRTLVHIEHTTSPCETRSEEPEIRADDPDWWF